MKRKFHFVLREISFFTNIKKIANFYFVDEIAEYSMQHSKMSPKFLEFSVHSEPGYIIYLQGSQKLFPKI